MHSGCVHNAQSIRKYVRATSGNSACTTDSASLECRPLQEYVEQQDLDMSLLTTPLDALHRNLGAKMVPFAGYHMPVQYAEGIIKEHLHTRQAAGLFDVSHMGQLRLSGNDCTAMLESLVPTDLEGLAVGEQTYSLFTSDNGGVLDDLIITRWSDREFFLVVNAGCKDDDIVHLRNNLGDCTLEVLTDQALLALQGPSAREIIKALIPGAESLTFMHGCHTQWSGVDVYVSCSGYTGEDGFEISIPAEHAQALAEKILTFPQAAPIGLGARDSLRLEAGLCLYGHELNRDINLVEAGLIWTISKTRRADGSRPGGFPGADAIFGHIEHGTALKRVGLKVEAKRPVREGQVVRDADGRAVGEICSAGYGASVGGPIAMAYVRRDSADVGAELSVDVRGKAIPVTITKLPFIPQNYFRG